MIFSQIAGHAEKLAAQRQQLISDAAVSTATPSWLVGSLRSMVLAVLDSLWPLVAGSEIAIIKTIVAATDGRSLLM